MKLSHAGRGSSVVAIAGRLKRLWRYGAPRPASGGCDFAASQAHVASTTTEFLLSTAPGLWHSFSDNSTLASVVGIFAIEIERIYTLKCRARGC
jgi:hypothetical protein